jgi:hypothetical protein
VSAPRNVDPENLKNILMQNFGPFLEQNIIYILLYEKVVKEEECEDEENVAHLIW